MHLSEDAKSLLDRSAAVYGRGEVEWTLIPRPRWERGNFGSRYHLVYPALALWVLIRMDPTSRSRFRPWLDGVYRALIAPRCWDYWHSELSETTPAVHERNLTYAGRLATFVGFYIDAFGEPPAEMIEVDGEAYSYTALSENLWRQMKASPSCGVSCFQHTSMVMCNAHLLMNNILHDRLFGSDFSHQNRAWLEVVETKLAKPGDNGPLFFYGTKPHSSAPDDATRLDSMDAWSLFLMSGVAPELTRKWFSQWRTRLVVKYDGLQVPVSPREEKSELASQELASAWALCAARELGDTEVSASGSSRFGLFAREALQSRSPRRRPPSLQRGCDFRIARQPDRKPRSRAPLASGVATGLSCRLRPQSTPSRLWFSPFGRPKPSW